MRIARASIAVLMLCGGTTRLLAELASPHAEAVDHRKKSSAPCEDCSLSTADGGGPYACPLFPIMTLSSGTIYYCDYFEPDCDAETQPAYLIGEFDYPAFCPECVGISSGARAVEFTGMVRPISVDAAKSRLTLGTDIQRTLQSQGISFGNSIQKVLIAGLVRLSVHGQDRVATVVRVDFSLRNSRQLNATGGRNTRYVGIEIDGLTNTPDVTLNDAVSPQQLPGGRAYRARFKVDGRNEEPLLILLAR